LLARQLTDDHGQRLVVPTSIIAKLVSLISCATVVYWILQMPFARYVILERGVCLIRCWTSAQLDVTSNFYKKCFQGLANVDIFGLLCK
jgi:hypothetical protein